MTREHMWIWENTNKIEIKETVENTRTETTTTILEHENRTHKNNEHETNREHDSDRKREGKQRAQEQQRTRTQRTTQ